MLGICHRWPFGLSGVSLVGFWPGRLLCGSSLVLVVPHQWLPGLGSCFLVVPPCGYLPLGVYEVLAVLPRWLLSLGGSFLAALWLWQLLFGVPLVLMGVGDLSLVSSLWGLIGWVARWPRRRIALLGIALLVLC